MIFTKRNVGSTQAECNVSQCLQLLGDHSVVTDGANDDYLHGVVDFPAASRNRELIVQAEDIRLVIWDLDETFWRGTLTEGGIQEYVQANHDIIVELARRGIISSVCSKNDRSQVLQILKTSGLLEYLVFPSIEWGPKGVRVAAIIEAMQLRPASVLFIDDNPNNLAEAQDAVPGLQVASELAIPGLLIDPLLKGKDDTALSRLAQYKLLETRKRDEHLAAGDSAVFLRSCDTRIYIERDVQPHLDRAIELINRTNQLNFTKKRLSSDPKTARQTLTAQLRQPGAQAGLVRVVDKYGDYGFTGFYLMLPGRSTLQSGLSTSHLYHFCFSCRTLGMLIEHWVFQALRRPEVTVIGEVLTDLYVEREINWIREVVSINDKVVAVHPIAQEIRIHGGCEATSVAHYLRIHAESLKVTNNFAAGPMFVRVNSAALMLSAYEHTSQDFERHMTSMGIPAELLGGKYFESAPAGTLFVFSGGYDAEPGQLRYRHRVCGWTLKMEVNGRGDINLIETPEEQLKALIAQPYFDTRRNDVEAIIGTIRNEYEAVRGPTGAQLTDIVHHFLELVPVGSNIVFMLDHEQIRHGSGTLAPAPWVTAYNKLLRAAVADYPFAGVASFGDCIKIDEEVHIGGNHYARHVYARMGDLIIEIAKLLPKRI